MDLQTIKKGKALACVSYLSIFGVLIAYFLNSENKNPFTRFHIRQSLGLWLTYFICAVSVSKFDSETLRYCLWISFGSLLIFGFFMALIGSLMPIPILGNLFQKWLKNI